MNKILWVLFSLAVTALAYYLLIRPFEYNVNFKANTLPGDLIETIRIWNRSLDSAQVIEVDSFSRLKQTIVWGERKYMYDWRFVTPNDSITKVNVQISEPSRSFVNKLLVPFTDQTIEKDASEIVNGFYDILKEHLKITDVKLLGEAVLDSSFCACVSLETSQIDKAYGMMREFGVLTSFIEKFKLKSNGPPRVRINQWNHSAGLIKFDFCFPIIETDSLPVVKKISYKKFNVEKVLRAEYHGNYITSDRAWYDLIHYAERNGHETSGFPIEYFHDNPTLGVNEREWRADVYLPIKN
jgi:effector-binding domain-containing protein